VRDLQEPDSLDDLRAVLSTLVELQRQGNELARETITELRGLRAGLQRTQAASTVPVAPLEAAVLPCENRVANHLWLVEKIVSLLDAW
jgi:hypothetical protein